MAVLAKSIADRKKQKKDRDTHYEPIDTAFDNDDDGLVDMSTTFDTSLNNTGMDTTGVGGSSFMQDDTQKQSTSAAQDPEIKTLKVLQNRATM